MSTDNKNDKTDKAPDARPDPPPTTKPEARIVPAGGDENAVRRQSETAAQVNKPVHAVLSGLGERARGATDHVGNGLSAVGGKAQDVAHGVAEHVKGGTAHVANGAHRAADTAKGAAQHVAGKAGDAAHAAAYTVQRAGDGVRNGAGDVAGRLDRRLVVPVAAAAIIVSGAAGQVEHRHDAQKATAETPTMTVQAATDRSTREISKDASGDQVKNGLEIGQEEVMNEENEGADPPPTPDAVAAGPPDHGR